MRRVPRSRRCQRSYPSHQPDFSRETVVDDRPGQRGRGLLKIAPGNPFEVKPRQQVLDGPRLAQVGRQDRRGEADLLGIITPVPHAWHPDRHRADHGDHLAFRQVTVAHQPCATICGLIPGMRFQQCRWFSFNRLLDQITRTGAQNVAQGITSKSMWIGQRGDGISRHVAYPFPGEN